MTRKERKSQTVKFSVRKKILFLTAAVALPFFCTIIYLLISMAQYSKTYDDIVSNLTIANNYNINFKEEMDESLYKLVVGYVSLENIEEESLKDPYQLIKDLRSAFTNLMGITTQPESRFWLQSLLRNIDTLKKRVDDIMVNVDAGGRYDENIEELDNNIYILTELIQDDIQYYIYYQTQSMEQVNADLNANIRQFMIFSATLLIIFVLAGILLSGTVVSSITKPIYELYRATKKVADGDFEARAKVKSQDEISVLAQEFNSMAENMQGLLDKLKEDEAKMRRADLRLLQEQINPHFLYNTLDTIVWLIEVNETEQATDMIVTLSDFFRMVLSKGKEFISIQEEERHIRSYLEIQEVRYRDILEYDISIDKVVYDYQILKLTLQPLVENALYYGIKYKRAKGYIHIHGEKEGNVIHLSVRDNGVGMDEETLEQLRQNISRPCQETDEGFGLANVNERIRTYFGPEYGMTINSTKGSGTIVEITIPAILAVDEKQKTSGGGKNEEA